LHNVRFAVRQSSCDAKLVFDHARVRLAPDLLSFRHDALEAFNHQHDHHDHHTIARDHEHP